MAENTIDNLSIQVTASAENATRVFDRLASGMGRVRSASQGAAGGMRDMAQGAQDAGTATKAAGTESGKAASKIRGVGKDAKDAGENAKKGSSGLKTFWESLKRIAFYRAVRSIIKGITEAFGTGITNLYHWSDALGGHFAASMDRLATSSQYLKNSLGAMVSPLIESFIPVLDVIIDKVVEVLNFFNMLLAAVSGADTYTVAKKAAAVWDDSANKAKKSAKSVSDEIKRTILGFDEINKLVKTNSSSSGSSSGYSGNKQPDYSSMFEEKPLTGIFKKISDITSGWPDWLKALLGVGTAGLAIFGIPALLKKIWDGLKRLFTINIPDWFRRLFGPKGDGDGGINIPDHIDIPDADVDVNLHEGDFSVLDDIEPVDITANLQRGWPGTVMSYLNLNYLATDILVGLTRGWSGTVLSYLNLNHLAVDIIVDLVREWSGTVLSYLNLNHLVTDVEVDLVRKWPGTALSYLNLNHLAADVEVDLKRKWPGTTLSYLNLNYLATNVEVDLVKKWVGTVLSYLNLNNLETKVMVDLARKWTGTVLSYLNLNYLETDVKVDLVRGWVGTVLSYLNLNHLETTVKVKLEKDNWDTVTNFVDKSFGGSSGGGGSSNGGGAGRNSRRSVPVDVSLEKGWAGTPQNALGIDKLNTNVSVGVNPLWALVAGGILGLMKLLDLKTNVSVGVKTPWNGRTENAFLRYLGINNLKTDVSVGVKKNWIGSVKSKLGLDNLTASVKVGLRKASGSAIHFTASSSGGVITFRKGGGVFANGRWSDIPQYAGGTTNAGSLFVAGEAGPEVVGHIGGRTEVLNKSQLASAVYSAVQAAMAPAAANFAAAAQSMATTDGGMDMTMLAEMIRVGMEQAMGRQNELDRQRNDLLRSINEKDYNPEISTASINKAQQRMNRRAGTTIVPVGT